MAYAQPADMVARYGEQELVRLSTPAGQDLAGIVQPPIVLALNSASVLIDTYLRRRYQVPMVLADGVTPPPELTEACCVLARYSLAHGEGRVPTDQMTTARRETIAWLVSLSRGEAVLDGGLPSSPESYAQTADRTRVFDNNQPGPIGVATGTGEFVGMPFWIPNF